MLHVGSYLTIDVLQCATSPLLIESLYLLFVHCFVMKCNSNRTQSLPAASQITFRFCHNVPVGSWILQTEMLTGFFSTHQNQYQDWIY